MTMTQPTPTSSPTQSHADAPSGTLYQRLDLTADFPYPKSWYIKRLVWTVVDRVLFRYSPSQLTSWRRFWLRRFGAKVHPTANIRPGVKIKHPWIFEIGEHACLGDDAEVYNLGPIRIADHTVISQGCYLCAGTHDYHDERLPLVRPEINIGRGVWICAHAFIGPGVRVGDNALVGARAVVTRDVPPATIVAGNPAKVIRDRPIPRRAGEPTPEAVPESPTLVESPEPSPPAPVNTASAEA
ncbi:MAG: hypothetical protein AAGK04_06505 [Planctomycetota bacterium]